jgi:TRAP-type mannitol/chloroaromatic compound transport system permease small subunit
VSDVKAGVKHVIADVIAKDLPTREALRNRFVSNILLVCLFNMPFSLPVCLSYLPVCLPTSLFCWYSMCLNYLWT